MFCLFVADYGYGHPGAFSPFLLNPGWLDAAYLNYAWADYFRPPQMRDQTASLVKGNVFFYYSLFELLHIVWKRILVS